MSSLFVHNLVRYCDSSVLFWDGFYPVVITESHTVRHCILFYFISPTQKEKATEKKTRQFLCYAIQGWKQLFLGHNAAFRRKMAPHGYVIF
jgi:hypothetical protein